MTTHKVGIIMNGVTGRMGLNQHLVRSIVAIRQQGGVSMPDGTRLMPDPILVGRDERKLRALAVSSNLPADQVWAARASGAGAVDAFRSVVIPTLRPSIIAAWLVVFVFALALGAVGVWYYWSHLQTVSSPSR